MSILFKHKVNWQYAIGEVILIFIGITLAIAFNNWNDDRIQQRDSIRQGTEYKKIIYQDLLLDTTNISIILQKLNLQYSSATSALEVIEEGILLREDSVRSYEDITNSYRIIVVERNDNTWDGIKRSGRHGDILDDELVSQVANLYNEYDIRIEHFNEIPAECRKGLRNIAAKSSSLGFIKTVAYSDRVFDFGNAMTYDPVPLSNMLKHAELIPLLQCIAITSVVQRERWSSTRAKTEAIISYMEENYGDILE